ncbi:MAG TPA: YeeE/YedE family protein [Thermohalobaculum sp.]|nr:YeeE/YedE family protein [Thermohalobaculum sp.]
MFGLADGQVATLAGFAGGIVLGLAARIGRYCIMGAVEDAVYGADLGRVRMLAMSAAVAIAGTFGLIAAGLLDPDVTRYFRTEWSPAGTVIGGLMFGYGMAMVGTCGFGSLARVGGGDLRGLVMVTVLGIAAYATIAGPLAPLRLWLVPPDPIAAGTEDHGLAHMIGTAFSVSPLVPALAIAATLSGWALLDPRFRRPSGHLLWSIAVGATIVFAWAATAWIAATGFDPVEVESFSFSAPIGQSLLYAMTASLSEPTFAIGAVAGVIVGAAVGSRFRAEFRWEACDDARELRRQMLGATSMGFGGVLAAGCTVGQGLSAFSVLSASAPVAIIAILLGARAGLFVLVERDAVQR